MADAYVNQASNDFAQLVWSKALLWPLRDQLVFDNVATARSTSENQRGKSVSFIFPNDLALATSDLDEVINPDSVAMSDSTVNIALKEKGNTMKTTALERATSMVDIDQVCLNLLGFNAGASLDTLAATALAASGNVQYQENLTNNAALTAAKTLTTKSLEIAKATFKINNVRPINGQYWLFAHPKQILDLRLEAGAGGWRYPRENGSIPGTDLITGDEGQWAGWQIVSTNREPFTADVGASGTVDVYSALAVGAEGLAKAYSDHPDFGPNPRIKIGLRTDPMMRTQPISWYHLVNYKILRAAAVLKLNTATSTGAN